MNLALMTTIMAFAYSFGSHSATDMYKQRCGNAKKRIRRRRAEMAELLWSAWKWVGMGCIPDKTPVPTTRRMTFNIKR